MASGTQLPVGSQFALAGQAVALGAFEIGIAEAVGIAEVLLVAGLAVDEDGAGILRLERDARRRSAA